ncbi:unnamed protein product, partial [Iphiclides podalirius]
MRCCVPNCKNDSRHISKSQGITFHVFPTEPSLRISWLKALGKESWQPKERSAVCSEHFHWDDLYETKSGLRKVRSGAVPVMFKEENIEASTSLKVCRICLDMNCKLIPIRKYRLESAYELLTGLRLCEEAALPQRLCCECAQRLISCDRLRDRSLRAHSLMMQILRSQDTITARSIQAIDRTANRLVSNLTTKHYEADHCDLSLQYAEPPQEMADQATAPPPVDLVTVFPQADLEAVVKEEDSNEIYLSEGETPIEPDDGHRGDLSDDSAPPEGRRTRAKKHRAAKKNRAAKRRAVEKKQPAEPKVDRRRKPFLNDDLNETLFTITDLTHEEQVAEIQKRRESSNYKNSVFKCTACFKGFLDEDAYNGHMTRHTDQCGEHECGICKTHFKHPHALRKHVTAHHTQRFSCNQCPYVTTHRQTARLHERWHKGTKYQCPHCQDEFVKFTTYMGHIRIKHPSDFVCELCGYSFVSEKGIELHKKLKHRLESDKVPEDGPYCSLCSVRFVSTEAYRRHLHVSARHSAADGESKDPDKPKKGRKSRDVKDREKRTMDKSRDSSEKRKLYPSQLRKVEGPIPCEQCGLQLEDSRAYHGHFRRMHPDKNRTNYPSMKSPCMCELCGRMFQSHALLKDHRWVHTGERPFACDLCGKAFRMRQRLVAHRRVHAQRRATYGCALCGKHFSTNSNRQRHMFIHTGLKPFACEMCGKCFKHASEKRAHVAYVHLKKPWPKRARAKRPERQGQQQQQPTLAAGASEMAIAPQLWPACEQKIAEAPMMGDKQMYYNIKI